MMKRTIVATLLPRKLILRQRGVKTKYLTFISTAFALLISSSAVLAQSTSAPSEIKLSSAAKKILCARFPLNSRCQASSTTSPSKPPSDNSVSPGVSTSPTEPTANPAADSDSQLKPNVPGAPSSDGAPGKVPAETPGGATPGGTGENPTSPSGNETTPGTTP